MEKKTFTVRCGGGDNDGGGCLGCLAILLVGWLLLAGGCQKINRLIDLQLKATEQSLAETNKAKLENEKLRLEVERLKLEKEKLDAEKVRQTGMDH